MNQQLHTFIYKNKFSGAIVFVSLMPVLTFWYVVNGVFEAQTLPIWRSQLEPVGQALMLILLPSFDAQFRVDNYVNAVLITLPAFVVLIVMPMYSLHRRIIQQKKIALQQINEHIHAAPKELVGEQIASLEHLLQRRTRITELSTWPLDTSVISRLLLYVIVPPLAWFSAAYVEIILSSMLSGH